MNSRTMVLVVFLGLLALSAVACAPRPAPTTQVPSFDGVPPWAVRTSDDCAACHPLIAAEWRQAMHSRSTREADGVYRILMDKAIDTMGEKARAGCSRCHEPDWAAAARKAGLLVEGVSCVVCHEVAPGHPQQKLDNGLAAALTLNKKGYDQPQALCLFCHASMTSPQGWPVCSTAEESADSKQTCVDCHLLPASGPPVAGGLRSLHRSHNFPGGWVPEFVRGSASLTLSLDPDHPGRFFVDAQRVHTGHDLPTGNPMRQVIVRVWALDENDNTIWSNVTDDPLVEDRAAVFQRLFVGADGKGPVPPFLAAGPADDNRLRAGEVRRLSYEIPDNAVKISAWMEYRLGPEPLLRKAGLTGDQIEPTIITRAELDLSE